MPLPKTSSVFTMPRAILRKRHSGFVRPLTREMPTPDPALRNSMRLPLTIASSRRNKTPSIIASRPQRQTPSPPTSRNRTHHLTNDLASILALAVMGLVLFAVWPKQRSKASTAPVLASRARPAALATVREDEIKDY